MTPRRKPIGSLAIVGLSACLGVMCGICGSRFARFALERNDLESHRDPAAPDGEFGQILPEDERVVAQVRAMIAAMKDKKP